MTIRKMNKATFASLRAPLLAGAVLLLSLAPALAQFTQQGPKLVGTGAAVNVAPTGNPGNATALSADGNTAIVGSPDANNRGGAAYVFVRSNGAWKQQAALVATGAIGATAAFGAYAALSADGNTAIVSGPGDNNGVGAAWVFTRDTTGMWTQKAKLVGSNAVGAAGQGPVALSADGRTAIIGGLWDNTDPQSAAGGVGAAWVFAIQTAFGIPQGISQFWAQQGPKLVGSDIVGKAWFGASVALSADGNTAFVGGMNDNYGAGAAWVFTRTLSGQAPNVVGTWAQQGSKLVGTGAVGKATQGYSVALSGDGLTAMVGGIGDNNNFGAAWVFRRQSIYAINAGWIVEWEQQGPKLVGSGAAVYGTWTPYQGTSVALSADGNTALMGGGGDNETVGATWVFTRSFSKGQFPVVGTWAQQGSKLTGSDAVGNAWQGSPVALSADGNTALIGGNGDNNNVGAGWVFTQHPTVTQVSPNYTYGAGGDTVTIKGTGFTAATAVTFGGVAATNLTLVNPTTITVTAPAHAPAAVDVAVTNSIGTGIGSSLYKYLQLIYRPLP
jgi:hypothetical protein